jgi:glycosyltransferase involved in cell wall biosynthesis
VLRSHPQIEITGAVPDIRPYLDAAAIYVIPMRVGGGTRFKALEAMAAAKPNVSTRLGVEGIPVMDGRELLLADTPPTFAAAILALLDDLHSRGPLAPTLGAAARRLVAAHYTWGHLLPDLEQLYIHLHAHQPQTSLHPGVQP